MRAEHPTHPSVDKVAERASAVLDAFYADEEYAAFETASLEYSEDWQCFTGFPVISNWDLEADKTPLLVEGLRALALKSAVYSLTSDENAAEIPVAVPVDEMTHAMIAQPQLLRRIADRIGMTVIHQTDQECTSYTHGTGFTYEAYRAAWGEPPTRYWIDKAEVDRRVTHLSTLYSSIGMGRSGRQHAIDFEAQAA